MFPFGNAFDTPVAPGFAVAQRWEGLATGGLDIEGDAGVRLARHYILYAFWEHGEMGTGTDESLRFGDANFGDQSWARTDYPGIGLRWSSRPDTTGLVVDMGLGYRSFREHWTNDTEIRLRGFGEFRLGFGVDARITPMFTISPMFMFSTGVFTDGDIVDHGAPRESLDFVNASHGTVTLTIGGHFDLGE
jgi:hypothetical protein